MKSAAAVLGLLVVLLSAFAYNVRMRSRPADREAPPTPTQAAAALPARTMTTALTTRTLAGVIRADNEAAVSPKTPGRIVRMFVREGEKVSTGHLLARLEIADMTAQVDAAREGVRAAEAALAKAIAGRTARRAEMDAAVAEAEAAAIVAEARLKQAEAGVPMTAAAADADRDQAEAAVRQAEAGVRQAEAALALAEDAARRLRLLEKHGGVAPVDVETAVKQADMARAARDAAVSARSLAGSALQPAQKSQILRPQVADQDVAAARAGLNVARRARSAAVDGRRAALLVADSDVRAAAAGVRQARAQLVAACATIGDGLLRSPITGFVTQLAARDGEFAQPGIPMMCVVGAGSLKVVVAVPLRDSGRIRLGQEAIVTAYSRAGSRYRATVAHIAPVFSTDSHTAEAVLRSPSLSAAFRPGEPVRVLLRLSPPAEVGGTLP